MNYKSAQIDQLKTQIDKVIKQQKLYQLKVYRINDKIMEVKQKTENLMPKEVLKMQSVLDKTVDYLNECKPVFSKVMTHKVEVDVDNANFELLKQKSQYQAVTETLNYTDKKQSNLQTQIVTLQLKIDELNQILKQQQTQLKIEIPEELQITNEQKIKQASSFPSIEDLEILNFNLRQQTLNCLKSIVNNQIKSFTTLTQMPPELIRLMQFECKNINQTLAKNRLIEQINAERERNIEKFSDIIAWLQQYNEKPNIFNSTQLINKTDNEVKINKQE